VSGRSSLITAVCAALLANAPSTLAADITPDPSLSTPFSNGAVLQGEIKRGDCRKLRDFAYKHWPARIYLASPGGSLTEALELGRLVRALKLQTFVPVIRKGELRERQAAEHKVLEPDTNLKCASACFFVFVAGIYRSQDYRFGVPLLGIHKPFLSEKELEKLTGDQAISTARQVRVIVESYLKEMGVAAKYVDEMFSIPKDEVRWISSREFTSDFKGIIPELR
jgi:hypothetical protein